MPALAGPGRHARQLAGNPRRYAPVAWLVVASWREFEAAEPAFCGRVRQLLTARKHLTMATLRKQGAPRISGIEIQIEDGELRIGSMSNSVKGRDLLRDARIAIHGPTSDPPEGDSKGWSGEAKIAGTAREVESGGEHHAFLIDIQEAVITHLDAAGEHLVIESWKPERGLRVNERT